MKLKDLLKEKMPKKRKETTTDGEELWFNIGENSMIDEIGEIDIPEPLVREKRICPVCKGKKEWFVKTAGCMYPCQDCNGTGFILSKPLERLDEKKVEAFLYKWNEERSATAKDVKGILYPIRVKWIDRIAKAIYQKFGTKKVEVEKYQKLIIEIEKRLERINQDIGERDKVNCHCAGIRFEIAKVYPKYERV